jgi:hypothetical protein
MRSPKKQFYIITLLFACLFSSLLHAGPSNLINLPAADECDPDQTNCNNCLVDESGVGNECVRVTLALGRTSVLSDRRLIQLKIFSTAASDALSTPAELNVVMGYTFRNPGHLRTSTGAPSTVDFVQENGEKLQFSFAEGSSLGIPTPGLHKADLSERLQMVDANGWATLDAPAYYDLYPGDGSVWRFMATDLTGQLGQFISFTDPHGRILTPDDFGVDIVRSPNGVLRQVLAPSRLADIVMRDETGSGYTVSVYPLTDADHPAFAGGLYTLPEHHPVEVLTVDRGKDNRHLIVTLKKGGADALRYDYAYINNDGR